MSDGTASFGGDATAITGTESSETGESTGSTTEHEQLEPCAAWEDWSCTPAGPLCLAQCEVGPGQIACDEGKCANAAETGSETCKQVDTSLAEGCALCELAFGLGCR